MHARNNVNNRNQNIVSNSVSYRFILLARSRTILRQNRTACFKTHIRTGRRARARPPTTASEFRPLLGSTAHGTRGPHGGVKNWRVPTTLWRRYNITSTVEHCRAVSRVHTFRHHEDGRSRAAPDACQRVCNVHRHSTVVERGPRTNRTHVIFIRYVRVVWAELFDRSDFLAFSSLFSPTLSVTRKALDSRSRAVV